MSVQLRWVGEDERDRVGEVRALCYGRGYGQIAEFITQLRGDRRSGPRDWLIAEREGVAVGTSTQYPLTMWVRGGAVACQGVAYVGTIKTSRRRIGNEPGVGTALMNETLRYARERGFVVSALMPFR